MRKVKIQGIRAETVAHFANLGAHRLYTQCRKHAYHSGGIHAGKRLRIPLAVNLLVGNLEFDFAAGPAFFTRGVAHSGIAAATFTAGIVAQAGATRKQAST